MGLWYRRGTEKLFLDIAVVNVVVRDVLVGPSNQEGRAKRKVEETQRRTATPAAEPGHPRRGIRDPPSRTDPSPTALLVFYNG